MTEDKIIQVNTSRGKFNVRDTQKGYPLVLIHGWPESSYCWNSLLPLMNEKYRLIRPDTRGMGDSERTLDRNAYLKQELALDIIALLDELDVKEFGLVGHDWGGVIAQEIALAVPERVRRLCLMNIIVITNGKGNLAAREALKNSGYTYNWYQTFQQQENLPEAMIPGNEETWLRHFLRMAKQKPFPEEAVQEYIRTFKIPGTATTSANYYRTLYQDMKRWPGLFGQKFKMPGMYIHGTRDIVIIPEYTHFLEECFVDFELVKLDVGHFVQEEAPEEVAQAMNRFFEPLIF